MGETRIDYYQPPLISQEILEKTSIVESVFHSSELILNIIRNHRLIAVNVKDSGGALVFFVLGTPDGFCYIFDILKCKNMVSQGGIKKLLESYDVVKIMVESRFFCDVMQRYDICPTNIFDAQIAHQLIEGSRRNCSPLEIERVTLCCICNLYGRNLWIPDESHYKQLERLQCNYLKSRPISRELAAYLAREVLCLVPEVYVHMCFLIPSQKENLLIYMFLKNIGLLPSDLSQEPYSTPRQISSRSSGLNQNINGRSSPYLSPFSSDCTNCINYQCKECQSGENVIGPTSMAWRYSPTHDDQAPTCSPCLIRREMLDNSHQNEINNRNDRSKRFVKECDDDDDADDDDDDDEDDDEDDDIRIPPCDDRRSTQCDENRRFSPYNEARRILPCDEARTVPPCDEDRRIPSYESVSSCSKEVAECYNQTDTSNSSYESHRSDLSSHSCDCCINREDDDQKRRVSPYKRISRKSYHSSDPNQIRHRKKAEKRSCLIM